MAVLKEIAVVCLLGVAAFVVGVCAWLGWKWAAYLFLNVLCRP